MIKLAMLIFFQADSAFAQETRLDSFDATAAVEFSSRTNIFSYRYIFGNPARSQLSAVIINMDITRPANGIIFSTANLANGPRFLQKSSQGFQRRTPNFVLPVGLDSPADWAVGTSTFGSVAWGAIDEGFELTPGKTLEGYLMTSPGLPGIRDFFAAPFRKPLDRNIGESNQAYMERLIRFHENVRFNGKTIGPDAPASLEPQFLIDRLISLKHQSVNFDWLRGKQFIEQLDEKLEQAKRALLLGRSFKARKKLEQFVQRLEQQKKEQEKRQHKASEKGREEREDHAQDDKKFLHDNAFFLLKPNAEFIISQLPPRPKDDQDKDDKDDDEENSSPKSPSRTPSQRLRPQTTAADPSFRLVAVYSFPNPARQSEKPTIRVQVGLADSVDIRIYNTVGRLVHSANLTVARVIDDAAGPRYAYDYVWDTTGVGSGVYSCAVTAHKAGQADIRKADKLAIIK